jgi:hypothetical protein
MQVVKGVGSDAGRVPSTGALYSMTWQVLVLDRRTLALVDNRVYGRCVQLPPNDDPHGEGCRPGPDGGLVPADLSADLRAYGRERLVIAALQPLRGRNFHDNWNPGKIDPMEAIGFPDPNDPIWPHGYTDFNGSLAGIGVPKTPEGGATISYVPGGRARMWGYLSADENNHYGFVPGSREQFDTRASATCDQSATGRCTIAQTTGDQTLSGSLDKGTSGYLVSVYDRWTLALKGSQTFPTGSPDNGYSVRAMATYLTDPSKPDGVVMITSLTTPGRAITTEPTTSAADWKLLAEAITHVGGTRHRFNSAASTAGADYSLSGWSGAGEGNGDEIAVAGARLRGALVPDERSRLTPVNVSANGPAAEKLQQLIVRDPVSRWPLDGDPGARAALAWIGSHVAQLGPHPRSAYWLKGTTLDVDAASATIRALQMPTGAGFDASAFARARGQLLQELRWVRNVRDYLGRLSQPYLTTIKEAFPASTTLADRLQLELKVDTQQAAFSDDWFELVESMLSLAGGLDGFLGSEAPQIAGIVVDTSAAAMEAGHLTYQSNFDGSNGRIDDDIRLTADELAAALTDDAQASVAALERMGNAIVSDPTKLAEVGRYGGCDPDGGCPAGYEQYGIDTAQAKQLASLGLERALYGQLMTRSFPVWDTGLARDPRPDPNFQCHDFDSPFDGSPPLAAAKSLEELDPNDMVTRWRTSIAVTRSTQTYSWPSETVLGRMFGPVNLLDLDAGGLGMTPQDVYRKRENIYKPGPSCGWWYIDDHAYVREPQ